MTIPSGDEMAIRETIMNWAISSQAVFVNDYKAEGSTTMAQASRLQGEPKRGDPYEGYDIVWPLMKVREDKVTALSATQRQEKKSMVYVVATANNVAALPPEMLRKGRFDEIWFVDLPGLEERKQIFDIHIRNKGRSMKKFPKAKITMLAEAAQGFTGAEIEECVTQGMFHAFYEDREFNIIDIGKAVSGTTPLKDIKPQEIADLRTWAKETKARPANITSIDDDKKGSKKKKVGEPKDIYWAQ